MKASAGNERRIALVTGANGFIGANLSRALLAEGWRVKAFVRKSSDLRSLEGIDVELVRGDVLDVRSLEAAAKGVDVLFHVASLYSYFGDAIGRLRTTALTGVKNASLAAASSGCARLVLTSSSVIFGSNASATPRCERDGIRREAIPYFESKCEQAEAAAEIAEANGVELVTVCPTVTVGPYDYRLGPSNEVILSYLRDGFRFTFAGGCNIVHAEDVARGHVLAALHGAPGERYILGGENLEWSLVHRYIADLCGVPGPRWYASHTTSYLVASVAELGAKLTGGRPVVTVAQTKAMGRFYWYSHDKATELGYRPRRARAALCQALGWLLTSPHVPLALRSSLRPVREVAIHAVRYATQRPAL